MLFAASVAEDPRAVPVLCCWAPDLEEGDEDFACGGLVGAEALAARAAADLEELALLRVAVCAALKAAATGRVAVVVVVVVARHIGPCCGSRNRGMVDIVFEVIRTWSETWLEILCLAERWPHFQDIVVSSDPHPVVV